LKPATAARLAAGWHVRLAARVTELVRIVRTIVGAPDYERYRRHVHTCHPATPMSRDQFTRERLARRYDQPGSRCC
jgi:uncharacterized short protein YbdD (DUF466 family)